MITIDAGDTTAIALFADETIADAIAERVSLLEIEGRDWRYSERRGELHRELSALRGESVRRELAGSEFLDTVDALYRARLVACAVEPYTATVSAEYERIARMARAALLLLTGGDEEFAEVLDEAWLECNEDISWLLKTYTREYLIENR